MDQIDEQYFLQVHEEIGNISENDISVSCPVCREGRSWGRKHRLHLYMKPGYDTPSIKCFNCEYSSNMYGYLKEFFPFEFTSYRKAKSGMAFQELKMNTIKETEHNTIEQDLTNINTGMSFETKSEPSNKDIHNDFIDGDTPVSLTELNSINTGLDLFSNSILKKPKEDLPIKLSENGPFLVKQPNNLYDIPLEARKYIENRGIDVQKFWLYSPLNNKIKFNNTDIILSDYIIVPFLMNDLWYGFQALAWKEKRFFIYMVTGNTGFKVENWDFIDKDKPVYIFESVYDRLSSGLENSIAALGANLSEDRLKELKYPVICLDNQNCDEKSKEQSLKYLHEGYSVFIWPPGSDKFKDTNDLRKINIPYEKIKNMILNNIHKGMKGILKLKFYN